MNRKKHMAIAAAIGVGITGGILLLRSKHTRRALRAVKTKFEHAKLRLVKPPPRDTEDFHEAGDNLDLAAKS
jgi:hypothetical protein